MSLQTTRHPSSKSTSRASRLGIGAIMLALVLVVISAAMRSSRQAVSDEPSRSVTISTVGVSALGTLEPASRIVRLSAPTSLEGARVAELLVAEGEWVESGFVVATLDTSARRQADLDEAEARVAVARSRLEQIRAGSKLGEISAKEAELAHADAAFHHAESEFVRARLLQSSRAISAEEFDKVRYQLDLARHEVARARGMLDCAREVREVDVRHAQAEIDATLAAVRRAKADLDATRVRSPIAGRILAIVARPGERVSDGGVLELGDTSEMHAVAEVYEADLPRVRVGQRARVRVPSCGAELDGEVVVVGQRVAHKVAFDNDPVADTDARVVEVRICIASHDSRGVDGLSNARVHVVIETCREE